MRATHLLLTLLALPGVLSAQSPTPSAAPAQPRAQVYREVGGQKLNAYVFLPPGQRAEKPTPAVLLFHGGGWVAGSVDWTFKTAVHYASLGLVAVAVDYRLSDASVTPIDALEDTCAAFRWVRQHAVDFNIDPKRVAGDGVSAGGHLVAAAATVGCPSTEASAATSRPDLLLLWSPALDVAADGWFRKLLQGKGSPSDYSPSEHAGASTPPTSIVQGAEDTLTTLKAAKAFCDRILQSNGVCDLNVYPGLGHLLTRNLKNQEDDFDPDPKARADGVAQQDRFLRERGYLPAK